MTRAGLWSALAFVLNLTWEIAQVRLYTIWTEADRLTVAWSLSSRTTSIRATPVIGIALRDQPAPGECVAAQMMHRLQHTHPGADAVPPPAG